MTSLATARDIGLVLLASPLVLTYFATWIVGLLNASLNWMSRASPYVVACHSAVVRASAVVRVSPDCQAAFARLLVARASPCWMSRASSGLLPDYLVHIARLTSYINEPRPYAFILCFAIYPCAARALD